MTRDHAETRHLTGDRAKESLDQDEFNLENITKSVAALLVTRIAADGYAIGIEGEWGSGKTTLANFIVTELSKSALATHKLILFDPWLVGTREALLAAFFDALIIKIQELGTDASITDRLRTSPRLLDRIIKHIEKYRTALQVGGAAADAAASLDPSGHTNAFVFVWKAITHVISLFKPRKLSLEALRRDIKHDLRTLRSLAPAVRFTVVIDDVDRLVPKDSLEVLRLINAVADFPLVTYLVCFDRHHLAAQIRRTLRVGTGHDYLEKIFQNIISIPPQEAFALRRFTRKLLVSRFAYEFSFGPVADRDRQNREEVLFDHWIGKFVSTPRDAVRLCDAVTLGWPYLQNKADFIDYVWLQLIKLKFVPLYSWVRDYVVAIGSFRDAGRPGDEEHNDKAKTLVNILTDVGWRTDIDRPGLSYFLPGVGDYVSRESPKVFVLADGELARFEDKRRLGSPSHWSLYFAFGAPSYALTDDIIIAFRKSLIDDQNKAAEIARSLITRPHPHAGYPFAVLLERIYDRRESLSDEEQVGLATLFANIMDEVPEPPSIFFALMGPWTRAIRLLGRSVSPHFAKLAANAPSINWMADVIRDQGFALGLTDPGHPKQERQWLSREQFDVALAAILVRFREMKLQRILKKPKPLEILFCWKQLGDATDLDHEIATSISSDHIFLELLDTLRTWVGSSEHGLYRPLRNDVLKHFLEPGPAKSRLETLANDANADSDTRIRAAAILQVWESDW